MAGRTRAQSTFAEIMKQEELADAQAALNQHLYSPDNQYAYILQMDDAYDDPSSYDRAGFDKAIYVDNPLFEHTFEEHFYFDNNNETLSQPELSVFEAYAKAVGAKPAKRETPPPPSRRTVIDLVKKITFRSAPPPAPAITTRLRNPSEDRLLYTRTSSPANSRRPSTTVTAANSRRPSTAAAALQEDSAQSISSSLSSLHGLEVYQTTTSASVLRQQATRAKSLRRRMKQNDSVVM